MSMRFSWLILWPLCLWTTNALTAADPAAQERMFSADVTDSNLREDVHVLRGNVRISQGTTSIEADQATASALKSGNSRWTFERAVHIQSDDADLKSDTASAAFSNGTLSTARVVGTPALFEHRRASDKDGRGRAEVIEYDFASGIVKLTGQVRFNYGNNEFRGDTVVYDLREEHVSVNPTGEKRGRVNITIRPQRGGGNGAGNAGAPPSDGESGE
jgi:lipopolysaccharide export system protein LptA